MSSVSQVKPNPTKLLSLTLFPSSFPPTNSSTIVSSFTPSPSITLWGFKFFSSHSQHNSYLMGSISHVITTNPTLPHPTLTCSRLSHFNSRFLFPTTRVAKSARVFAEVSTRSSGASTAIDFSDPDWKIKFQEDWEARFRLPHLTDVFPDAPPIPSTFCLKMRLVGRSSFLYPLFGTTQGKQRREKILKETTNLVSDFVVRCHFSI